MKSSFLLLLICSNLWSAQSNSADLETQLANSDEAAKPAILAELCGLYAEDHADKTIMHGEAGLALLKQYPNPKLELSILADMAKAQMLLGDYPTALEVGERARVLAMRLQNQELSGDVLNTIGVIFWHLGDYHTALSHYLNALEIRERLGNPDNITASLNNIANVHIRLGDYNQALDFYRKALAIREEGGNKAGVAASLNNLGVVYKNLGDNDKALEHYQKSLKINEEEGNQQGIALSLLTMGNVFRNQGDLDAAIAYFQRSMDILEELGNREGFAGVIQALGDVHLSRTEYNEALNQYQRALAIREEIGNKHGIAGSLESIGMVYKISGQTRKALDYYLRALDLHTELGNRRNIAAPLSDIALLYTRLGRHKEAYQYLSRNLILQKERVRETAELQNKLRTENQEKVLALLKKENQIRQFENERRGREIQLLRGREQIQALENQRKVSTRNAALVVILLISALAFYIFKRRGDQKLLQQERTLTRTLEEKVLERTSELKSRNTELEVKNTQILEAQRRLVMQEKMASLGSLTAGIAHEMKNPLNFVNNFSGLSAELVEEIQAALQKTSWDEEDREDVTDLAERLSQNLDVINRHGSRANEIVVKMMELAGGSRATHQPADINNLVREYSHIALKGSLNDLQDAPDIQFETQLDPSIPELSVIPSDLGRVIIRIVENAVESLHAKAQQSDKDYQPRLIVKTCPGGDLVDLIIHDNGQGMKQQHLGQIFQPFFTTKSKAGAHIGLGLAIAYDIVVDGHGGDLRVETVANEYTKMIISLPKKPIIDQEGPTGAKDSLELSHREAPTKVRPAASTGEVSS